LEAVIARACEAAPVSRVAQAWQMPPETVRRLDKRMLRRWPAGGPRLPLCGPAGFCVASAGCCSVKVAQHLSRHRDGTLAYCHVKVPFGNIRAMLRRGRGYRDHEYLLLKVQKATADRQSARRAA
jgi:hypothetical protein